MNSAIKYLIPIGVLSLFSILLVSGFVGQLSTEKNKEVNQDDAAKSNVCDGDSCIETEKKNIIPLQTKSNETNNIQVIEEPSSEGILETREMKNSIGVSVTAVDPALTVSKANVPVTIPLHQGYYMKQPVYYIITDSSDKTHADIITKNQGWKAELAPLLANATKDALSKTYMFTNGVKGNGVHGFQGEVFTSTPAQPDTYSALTSHIHVTWDDAATPKILDSEKEILGAQKQGLVTLSKLNVVLNMPQIVWPESQMPVKADKTLTDETPFVGGQVLDIDLKKMTVTFIAHRGWDGSGKTIYYIVTDASPVGPAVSMGVTNVPNNAKLASSPAAIDMFHFMNGITGSGPLGFQEGISSSAPGDKNYSPMKKIYFISWKNPKKALELQTANDVEEYQKSGQITVNLAKPMNADHIINAPIVDPFQ